MITASQKIATNPDPATFATSSISSQVGSLDDATRPPGALLHSPITQKENLVL